MRSTAKAFQWVLAMEAKMARLQDSLHLLELTSLVVIVEACRGFQESNLR